MDVRIDLERSHAAPVPLARALGLMENLEGSLRLFPKLRRLEVLSAQRYVMELEPIGTAGVSHVVVWASAWDVDVAQGRVTWKPFAGRGNARIEGEWSCRERRGELEMVLRARGVLEELRVPLALRPFARSFVSQQFEALVARYLEKLAAAAREGC